MDENFNIEDIIKEVKENDNDTQIMKNSEKATSNFNKSYDDDIESYEDCRKTSNIDEEYSESYEDCRKTSIGKDKKTSTSKVKENEKEVEEETTENNKKTTEKNNRKRFATIVLAGAIGFGILRLGLKEGHDWASNKFDFAIDSKVASEIVVSDTKADLVDMGLAFIDEDDVLRIKNNTLEEYIQEYGELTPREFYALRETVNESEIAKVLAAYGYGSADEYYKANGYVDKETKEPSEEVFDNYMEAEIVEEYRNGTLSLDGNHSKGVIR